MKKKIYKLYQICLALFFCLAFLYVGNSQKKEVVIYNEFRDFLSIPNNAKHSKDILKNAKWCKEAFRKRGFTIQELSTETVPVLLASKESLDAKQTILIYLQIDGQPVDPNKWDQENPYQPVLKQKINGHWKKIPWTLLLQNEIDPEWRIFARSVSDAKGPVLMFLAALDRLKINKQNSEINLKVIMDFEEEIGSPRLSQVIKDNKEKFEADAMIVLDGPRHISNSPTIVYGARGIVMATLKVYGPKVPLHSGHYGNYAPNPAWHLSHLLASMKDKEGRVKIDGWYDGIELLEEVKKILGNVPDDENYLNAKIGIAKPDKVGNNYQESLQYPSLNIVGLNSAWIDEQTRNIVPATAQTELDIRLVKESNPEKLIQLLKKHISDQGFTFVKDKPTDEQRWKHNKLIQMKYSISYPAFRTDFNTSVGKWLRKGFKKVFNNEPIQIRTSGGSVPIAPFVDTINIPAIIVPMVNPDNNQHSPNENLRIGNFIEGIDLLYNILTTRFY